MLRSAFPHSLTNRRPSMPINIACNLKSRWGYQEKDNQLRGNNTLNYKDNHLNKKAFRI